MDAEIISPNKALADSLALVGSYYSMALDKNRARTFFNASTKIAQAPLITRGSEARSLGGIGDSIEQYIDEFFRTGYPDRLRILETEFKDRKQIIDYFRSFFGIGPVKAVKMFNDGLRSLEDIWIHGNLTDAQKLGIMWREHINLRISREEISVFESMLSTLLPELTWNITGSYRRNEPDSGDIDLLISTTPGLTMESVVTRLQHLLPATLAMGSSKYLGIVRLGPTYNGHRIDILLVNPDQYSTALMYFTGSQRFNILMRNRAIEFGYTLNEFGLYDNSGNLIPTSSEQDIFDLLRVSYLPPPERTRVLDHLPIY